MLSGCVTDISVHVPFLESGGEIASGTPTLHAFLHLTACKQLPQTLLSDHCRVAGAAGAHRLAGIMSLDRQVGAFCRSTRHGRCCLRFTWTRHVIRSDHGQPYCLANRAECLSCLAATSTASLPGSASTRGDADPTTGCLLCVAWCTFQGARHNMRMPKSCLLLTAAGSALPKSPTACC